MQTNPVPFEGRTRGNARRSGRVRVHMIGCQLGELMDLSATGARLACKGRAAPRTGDVIRFGIDGLDGHLEIAARVVRSKRLGWFSHELGLEFVDVDPPTRAALAALARTAPANQTFGLAPERRESA